MAERIDTFPDLQARAGEILDRLRSAPILALAAAANPLLAVEHLGYQFDPKTRPGIADRIRLGPTAAGQLAELRTTIARLIDRQVDPDDGPAVRRLLTDLGVLTSQPDGDEPGTGRRRPSRSQSGHGRRHPDRTEPGVGPSPAADADPDTDPPRWHPGGAGPDPLEPYRGRHPVLEPLLEYRRISARRPRFAPPHAFAAILDGTVTTPLTAVRGRLQSPPPAHPR